MGNRLYRILVPVGSRRDRFAWITMVTVRKMREGPGPWLRAVKKGVYQLLPLRAQQRLLRWTGKEQFFRRGEVRHASADQGVDRPGLVSVVLPVYQQADMIAASIASVLNQDHRDLELIIVDDGSTDGVAEVVRPFLDDPRVRVLSQPNQGLPKALSTGFDAATGEFFTWTSADNLMMPQQLSRLVAFLRERPATTMVYADYELIDQAGAALVGGEFRVLDRTDKTNLSAVRVKRETHDLNRYEDNFIGACFLYRGQTGRLLGDYNPELGLEDYDYWMRINRLFRIEHLGTDEVLYRYRVHDNTLSARARELKILERARVLMEYERQRGAWVDAPMDVLACAGSHAWLSGCVQAPDRLLRLSAAAARTAAQKTLVVTNADDLCAVPLDDLPPQVAVAAFFANVEEVYRARDALRRRPLAAFAADADVAARLAVFTRTVFVAGPGPEAYSLAVRYAANATFFGMTRDRRRLQRAVPTPLVAQLPLRVLLQLDSHGRGGLERVVRDLAVCLLERGCAVGLLAVDGSHARAGADLPAGLEIVQLTGRGEDGYADMLERGGWHVVSAHASVFGAAAAAAAGVPFVQTVHNSYVWFDGDDIARYRAADAHTAAYACVSAEALSYADQRLQLDVQKALVIENGIAPAAATPAAASRSELRAELGLADDDFVYLQVASLQPAKAHRVAVQALARARQQDRRLRLVCLGHEMNPVHAAAVRGDVARASLEDAVVFAGHREDPQPFYAMADALLLPSYWEGCSLAVWEAIQAGLPLVLSAVGAAREQLRWGRGVLVPPPFAAMTELDAGNLAAVTGGVDPGFVAATAEAMLEVAAAGARRTAGALPPLADRGTMARRHELLFRWLRQGGSVPGIRELIARAGR